MSKKRNPYWSSPIREWMENNQTATNIMAVWLLFVVEIVVAKFFGDFDLYYNNDFPAQKIYVVLIISSGLVLLSFINVYLVPTFVNWFHSDKPKPATRLVIVGTLFSSFFCAPLFGIALGLAFALFLFLTLVHMFSRVIPTGGDSID